MNGCPCPVGVQGGFPCCCWGITHALLYGSGPPVSPHRLLVQVARPLKAGRPPSYAGCTGHSILGACRRPCARPFADSAACRLPDKRRVWPRTRGSGRNHVEGCPVGGLPGDRQQVLDFIGRLVSDVRALVSLKPTGASLSCMNMQGSLIPLPTSPCASEALGSRC